jgi:hypothetical protein
VDLGHNDQHLVALISIPCFCLPEDQRYIHVLLVVIYKCYIMLSWSHLSLIQVWCLMPKLYPSVTRVSLRTLNASKARHELIHTLSHTHGLKLFPFIVCSTKERFWLLLHLPLFRCCNCANYIDKAPHRLCALTSLDRYMCVYTLLHHHSKG